MSLCNQGCSTRPDYVIQSPRCAIYISIPGLPPPHLKHPGGMGVGHMDVPHPHAPMPPSPPHGMRGHVGMWVDVPHPHAALLACGVGWAKPARKPPLPSPLLATHPRARGEEGGVCGMHPTSMPPSPTPTPPSSRVRVGAGSIVRMARTS